MSKYGGLVLFSRCQHAVLFGVFMHAHSAGHGQKAGNHGVELAQSAMELANLEYSSIVLVSMCFLERRN